MGREYILKKISGIACFLGFLAMAVYWTDNAWAGNNGWFTTYNSDVERGEIELMFMNDLTAPSKHKQEEDGRGDYDNDGWLDVIV